MMCEKATAVRACVVIKKIVGFLSELFNKWLLKKTYITMDNVQLSLFFHVRNL